MDSIIGVTEAIIEAEQPTNSGDDPAETWTQFLISLLVLRGVLTSEEAAHKGADLRAALVDGLNMAAQNGSEFASFRHMRDHAEHAGVWRKRIA